MILILTLTSLLFFALFLLSLRLNLRQSEKIEEIYEKIEESLDILDICYQRISKKSSMEVFSDEPVVKQLVQDIKMSREAIVIVANIISNEKEK